MLYVLPIVFIFGALIGSFLNVVILRLPLGKSVVKPRSSCGKCGHFIRWYENIPIISYLILRGRCSSCGEKIGLRYPIIEFLGGLIAVLLFPKDVSLLYLGHYDIAEYLFKFSVAMCFLAHFIIDVEHQLLPDKINIYLLLVILPYSALNSPVDFWLFGGLLGFLGPYLVTWLFYKIKGQVGLGGGDIKLFGILGVLLGPVGVMHTLFLSSFVGALVGLGMIVFKKMQRNTALAFGPYIILVATVQIFFPKVFALINPFGLN